MHKESEIFGKEKKQELISTIERKRGEEGESIVF